ncbi:MAG: hypothetical protein QOF07_1209 [Bradyrhizobium sp.]|nr:hypothetical protein [Bradyrhizobium sp.]
MDWERCRRRSPEARVTSPCGRGRIASTDVIRVRGYGLSIDRDPSPQPSPTRGEGAHRCCRNFEGNCERKRSMQAPLSSSGLTGRSSTPRPFGFIIGVSGILDRPLSRATTAGRIPAARRARVLLTSRLPKNQRAQGRPGARCTRGLACKMRKQKRTRAYRFSGGSPAFPAQWFYGLYRALPGDRAFLPPSPLRSLLLKNLTPASGRQDHTALPSASARFVKSRRRVHRIPPRVRDVRTPLCGVGRANQCL